MATINNKLIHFKSKSNFNSRYAESTDNGITFGDFLGTSIVFIQDAKEIWTHGQFFKCVSDEEFEKLSTIGDVSLLETTIKDNLVNAVNELKNSVDSKQNVISFNTEYNAESNKAATIQDITNATENLVVPYEINLTNLLSAEDSESISTAIGGIDNLNATVQDNRIIVGTISNGSVSVSIRILGNVTTLYYLLDSVLGLTLNEIAITNTSGTLSKSVTTHSVLTENMVINSLNSDETTLPLSAAQGKALNSKIDSIDVSADITKAINALDSSGQSADTGEVISSVSQENGVVSVSKKSLVSDDIPELPQSKITGLDTALADKQNATDETLNTTDKTVVGAINEILPKATGVGKVDPNSDGTGEIFNSYEGGNANVASGGSSHAEGIETKATGNNSHAEGSRTNATVYCSHAEGDSTTATGDCSHAEGFRNTAEGRYSHAEGSDTTASGGSSHAEGRGTTATGGSSHAEGSNTNATGDYSHAEGSNTNATGGSSHAEGQNTQALTECEHAEGKYNKSYDSFTSTVRVIHSVGIGSSNTNRKNAHEIKINGDHYIYGLGGFDGTNSADAQTLQTVITGLQTSINTIESKQTVYTTVPTLTADYNIPANATTVEKVYDITVGATLYNITYADGIKWVNDVAPITRANHRYVVSIINNLGVWGEF